MHATIVSTKEAETRAGVLGQPVQHRKTQKGCLCPKNIKQRGKSVL